MKETRKPVSKPAPSKGKTAVRKKAAEASPRGTQPLARYDDKERIRQAAYYLAERRGFVSGHELEDWLAAEAEARAVTAPPQGARQATGQRRSAKAKKN